MSDKKPKETIQEVIHDMDKVLKEKDLKLKQQFHQGGKDENGKNKTLKQIENDQVI